MDTLAANIDNWNKMAAPAEDGVEPLELPLPTGNELDCMNTVKGLIGS